MMNLLHFDELPATPWKNGGGITRELACFPHGAGLDDFVWRASIADVGQSGPFSHFPGVERVIMLLAGDGMQLQFEDGARHDLTAPLQPLRFHGEAHVNATLAGAPSQDFNLMLRRELASGEIVVWHAGAAIGDIAPQDGFVLFHCAAGEWQLGAHRLKPRDTLVGAPDAPLRPQPLQAGGALVGVRVRAHATFNGEKIDEIQ
jgi:environmental stress-induced protein Ves